MITQQGQVIKLRTRGADGKLLWACCYRVDGRGSARPQVGGFASQGEALRALKVALARQHRGNGRVAQITLSELVEEYLVQHEAEPRPIAKLHWLLAKATGAFGERRVVELRSDEIGAWRATLPEGHRFEATQALRQVLNRAVAWRIIDSNPAKVGVDNPRRQHPEKRPFESWAEIKALAEQLGPVYGAMIVFAAATGLRPGEWISLEQRDLDREGGRLRAEGLCARAAAGHEDPPQRARRAAASNRARGTRPVAGTTGHAARVSGTARRLSRPAQLPPPRTSTRTRTNGARSGSSAASPGTARRGRGATAPTGHRQRRHRHRQRRLAPRGSPTHGACGRCRGGARSLTGAPDWVTEAQPGVGGPGWLLGSGLADRSTMERDFQPAGGIRSPSMPPAASHQAANACRSHPRTARPRHAGDCRTGRLAQPGIVTP